MAGLLLVLSKPQQAHCIAHHLPELPLQEGLRNGQHIAHLRPLVLDTSAGFEPHRLGTASRPIFGSLDPRPSLVG